MVKPFNKKDLFTTIEIAFNNYNQESLPKPKEEHQIQYLHDVIFIKSNQVFYKVDLKDILFLESENVYLTVHTHKRDYTLRMKLEDFIEKYAQGDFVRIHRSYAINLKHLEQIGEVSVNVAGKDVPLQKTYKQDLLQMISALK